MQTTLLPKELAEAIEKLIRNFLWGGSSNRGKCHLVKWETITRSKAGGGLGLRNLEAMNEAFLAKLGWRLTQEEDCLWVQVLKTKHAVNSTNCSTWKSKTNMSNIWKGIMKSTPTLSKGTVRLVRNCMNTLFWIDNWLGPNPLYMSASHIIPPTEINRLVASYWIKEHG